jgi:hypothetical protein
VHALLKKIEHVCVMRITHVYVTAGLAVPKAQNVPASLLPEENAAISQERDAARLPSFEIMVEYLASAHVVDARARMSTAVKAAMVSFCSDCLTHSCKQEGVTRAQYLDASGGEHKTLAAKRFHTMIADALSSALSTGAKQAVNDTMLARTCFVSLLDLLAARKWVYSKLSFR